MSMTRTADAVVHLHRSSCPRVDGLRRRQQRCRRTRQYLAVFRVAGTTAFIAYAAGFWQQSIWYNRPWSTTLKLTFDGLIYGLLTGGAFGWLWLSERPDDRPCFSGFGSTCGHPEVRRDRLHGNLFSRRGAARRP